MLDYFRGQHLLALSLLVALSSLSHARAQTNTNLPPLKYEEPKVLTASIYAIGSARKTPLYKFTRHVARSGDRLDILREYTYPDGRIAAREKAVYQGDSLILWELEDLQTHARGRATLQPGPGGSKLKFEYYKNFDARSAPKTRLEELQKNTLVSDMVGPFLRDNWTALADGKEVKCRYIVVPRCETVGFTFEKIREEQREGKEVLIVKMSPTSAIISALVDPLFFTIEKGGNHRVLEYTGRTTPKLKAGGKWKDLDAKTVFEW